MARIWETYCHEYDNGFRHFGSAERIKFHDSKKEAVKVKLVEDPEGEMFGWIPAGKTEPIMVLRKHLFDIQFPDGHQANEKAGKGCAVSLRVDKV